MIASVAGRAPFFGAIVVSGSHEASVKAVTDGEADLASIDCVSFALLSRGRPELIQRVTVVAESEPSPNLPFIASASFPGPTIAAARGALFTALADPALAEARATLGLRGARPASPADYDRAIEIEHAAQAAGYRRLA